MGERPWRTLVELDAVYARSRRRSALRRSRIESRPKPPPQLKRALLLALVLFVPLAELSVPTTSAVPTAAAPTPVGTALRARLCPVPAEFRPAFVEAAADAHLPLALLVAVARVESEMNPHARSPVGAQGLLQLMPATARELRLDPTLPHTNVLAGARYLRQMLDRFGNVELALAAYNAGPTAVERAGGAPTGVTVSYVGTVQGAWRSLAGCR